MRSPFKALKYFSLFLLISIAFVACDKEFNAIESEVLGEGNANFNTRKDSLQILAYSKKLDSLQINNLGSSLLGFYDDPHYGEMTASLIMQATPTIDGPSFGDEGKAVIDSVILNIPYFSRATEEFDEEIPLYTLNDSIFGNQTLSEDEVNKDTPIKLTIYRNNYFLRDFDPNSDINTAQNYYSNALNADKFSNYGITESTLINFDDNKGEVIYETESFIPDHNAVILTTGSEDDGDLTETISTPALRINLADEADEKAYWSSLILEKQDDPVLSNSNNFKNYFRGLYFKAEATNNDGQMILLNTSSTSSQITIYYTTETTTTSTDSTTEEVTTTTTESQSTYTLNLYGNNTLNPIINNFNFELQNGDKIAGDEKLYLKGVGSMAIVDLFNGLVPCEESNTEETALDCFRKTYRQLNEDDYILKSGEEVSEDGVYITKNGDFVLKRLINEAQLIIYEDETIINTDELKENHTYDRIYAYDIENNSPTFDYIFDGTDNTTNPEFSKFVSLGIRTTDDDGFSKYKIRVTEHLNNILYSDSTNTKLGLVLSNNVNITSNSEILNSNDVVTSVPSASILSPRGTVLHAHNTSNPELSISLEIFLTEQKQ